MTVCASASDLFNVRGALAEQRLARVEQQLATGGGERRVCERLRARRVRAGTVSAALAREAGFEVGRGVPDGGRAGGAVLVVEHGRSGCEV